MNSLREKTGFYYLPRDSFSESEVVFSEADFRVKISLSHSDLNFDAKYVNFLVGDKYNAFQNYVQNPSRLQISVQLFPVVKCDLHQGLNSV